MRFYRLEYRTEGGCSAGFKFFTSEREARAAMRAANEGLEPYDPDRAREPERIQVEPTRSGILDALNRYGGHADNG